jgi:hypothetical protein
MPSLQKLRAGRKSLDRSAMPARLTTYESPIASGPLAQQETRMRFDED